MQGTILSYIGSIVTAIILSEVLLSLLPEGNMQKFVKPVIGILLLLLLLSPLKKCSSTDISVPETEKAGEKITENTYEDLILDVYNQSLANKNK